MAFRDPDPFMGRAVTKFVGGSQKEQIIGWAWFASFALGIGGVIDALLGFQRDNKDVWTGNVTTSGTTIYVQTGVVNDPGGSGNGPSPVVVYLGTQTAADPMLAAWTGYDTSYKGKSYMSCCDAFVGDNATNAPAMGVIVKHTALIPSGIGGFTDWSTYQDVNFDAPSNFADANPAHVLLYILLYMVKVDVSLIDVATFRQCGITLKAENLGISFQMDNAQAAEEWITEILRTIDAAVWHDLVTNKTKMALFRDDYTVSALTTLTDSDIKKLEFERQAWEDFPTEVTLKYTNRVNFKGASFSIKNPAARKMLGYNKPEEYSYMMISNLVAMQGVVKRLVKKLFYPLLVLRFTASRAAFPTLSIGQCVKVTSTTFGFTNLVVRITNIGSDTFAEQEMEVEAIQDPYGMADLNIQAGTYSLATDQDWTVGAIAQARIIDAPAEVALSSAVLVMFTPPTGSALGVRVSMNDFYQYTAYSGSFGYGVLNTTLSATGVVQHVNIIQDGVGFYINTGGINIVEVAAARAAFQRLKFTLIMGSPASGWEIIGFQNCTRQLDGRYYIDTLMRGLNNTTIRSHSAGEEVWLYWSDANEMSSLSVVPASIHIDLQGYNQRTEGPEKSLGTYVYGYTQETPYPVSNLKATRVGSDITLTWMPCKRLGLAGYRAPENFPAGNDTPEGSWIVRWNDGTAHTVDVAGTTASISYTRTDASSRTYYVRSALSGYLSAERNVTI